MRKTLKELTFKDNFLFAATMLESAGQDSMNDYGDSLVKTLQASIKKIKSSREMEDRYMTLEQLIKDERKEAKAEGRADEIILDQFGRNFT